MPIRILMLQTRQGDAGAMLQKDQTYTVSEQLGQSLVGSGYARSLETSLPGDLGPPVFASSVSGAGKQMAFDSLGVIPIAVAAQFPGGKYLVQTQFNPAPAILTGDPLVPGYTTADITAMSMSAGNGLMDTTGAVIGGANAGWFNWWLCSNGDIFGVCRGDANTKNYLFRAKYSGGGIVPGSFTVGSGAAATDKKAVLDIGKWNSAGSAGSGAGVQSTNIRHLANRSFLEAKVNGATHYFFCEYNVSGSRTAGSGGAGEDQVIVYRSTDLGVTWAVFLEFNTGGAHVIDHCHGAAQCPYSGWIYFMFGDVTNANNIIAYNGTASAVAPNTPLATIAATPGYRVIGGNERSRMTDMCFTPTLVYGLLDSDTEAFEASTIGFTSVVMPKLLDYVAAVAPLERLSYIPPILALQQPGWAMYASLRGKISAGNPEMFIHLWTSDAEAGAFKLVAKATLYVDSVAIPKWLFVDDQGRVWLSGTFGGGVQFTPTTASGSSVCLRPRLRLPSDVYPLVI